MEVSKLRSKFTSSFLKLKSYCEAENFKGWDPYDGMNSKGVSGLTIKALGFRRRLPYGFKVLNIVRLILENYS